MSASVPGMFLGQEIQVRKSSHRNGFNYQYPVYVLAIRDLSGETVSITMSLEDVKNLRGVLKDTIKEHRKAQANG